MASAAGLSGSLSHLNLVCAIAMTLRSSGARPGAWVSYKTATTVVILIRGEIHIRIRDGGIVDDVMLAAEGDYVILPPIIEHTWEALSDCVVLSVRCPSVADEQIETYS
jgi:uncharacterized RmlC-like cupin family protein